MQEPAVPAWKSRAVHDAPAATFETPSEDRFRRMVEQIPAIVYIETDEYPAPATYMSPRIRDVLGIPPEAFTDRNIWLNLVHPDDLERFERMDRVTALTHENFVVEYRARALGGHYVWFRDEAVFVREGEGGYWQGVMVDITDEKRLEQEHRGAAARFRTLVDQIPAVVYIDPLDPEPVAANYVSEHIQRMLGVSAQTAVSDPDWWIRLLHPEDRARALNESNRADLDRTSYRSEYRMVATDGRVVWVHDEAVLVNGENGEPAYWQGVLHDISERKRAETDLEQALGIERAAVDRLREADEMKNTFLTAVSHDLRTPLATILGNAVTLEHEEELGISAEDRRDLAHTLAEKARLLTRIVTNLLDLDRLARTGTELSRTPVDVSTLVRGCVANIDLGDRTVLVETHVATVSLDGPMVERILENLLHNAARHTPPGTTVWVRAVPIAGGGALLCVEDDGPGVPEHLRETLFRPFERGPSASAHAPGSGIGLSLVASFAALHGGRAWVEDRTGGGAAFRVALPAAPGRRAKRRASAPSPSRGSLSSDPGREVRRRLRTSRRPGTRW